MAMRISQFVDSKYGSAISLELSLETGKVTGSYDIPPTPGMFGGYVHGVMQGFGKSRMEGEIEKRPFMSGLRLKGSWTHDGGMLTAGSFSLEWDEKTRTMRGYWAEGTGEENEWVWTRVNGIHSHIAKFVHSKLMTQYVVLLCWVYVVLTAFRLIAALRDIDAPANITAHAYINAFCIITYASFLFCYRWMHRKPALFYELGVATYTLAYSMFLAYYGIFTSKNELYVLGSVIFIVGSLFLMISTGPGEDRTFQGMWSPFAHRNSLFWGSASFYVGSLCFTADSVLSLAEFERSAWVVELGYAFFLVGYLYFLWGSTTPDVGPFLVKPGGVQLEADIEVAASKGQPSFSSMMAIAELASEPSVEPAAEPSPLARPHVPGEVFD